MLKTVEVRWFFPGEIPHSVRTWFKAAAPNPVTEPLRTDYYLNLTDQITLGIKIRQGWLEVKQRQRSMGSFKFHDKVFGRLESWTKWGIELGIFRVKPAKEIREMWLPVAKDRRLYSCTLSEGIWRTHGGKLGLDDQSCEIELSNIALDSRKWWTFAFEASGKFDQEKSLLIEAAQHFLTGQEPPPMPLDCSFSYPQWISQVS